MRDGLDTPTLQLGPNDVESLRSFLDAQSRIELLVWVRHEQQGAADHHLVFGVPDADYRSGDMWALEQGLEVGLEFSEPSWTDIFPLSEVEALRAFGTVLWERDPERGTGDDPLDYRQTWEPYEADPPVVARFCELVAAETPWVERVDAALHRLWKGGEPVRGEAQLYVHAPADARPTLPGVMQAVRRSGLATDHGATLGSPRDPRIRTATLYEAAR